MTAKIIPIKTRRSSGDISEFQAWSNILHEEWPDEYDENGDSRVATTQRKDEVTDDK